jgi:hypothetical protein
MSRKNYALIGIAVLVVAVVLCLHLGIIHLPALPSIAAMHGAG